MKNRRWPSRIEQAIPALRKSLEDADAGVRYEALYALSELGSRLSEDMAEKLEGDLPSQVDDIASHVLLFQYYLFKGCKSEACRLARQKHGLWLIEHIPEFAPFGGWWIWLDPVEDVKVYDEAKRLWLKQLDIREGNPEVAGNASNFFSWYDPELSKHLLRKAQALEPSNPKWVRRLAALYERGMWDENWTARQEEAARALSEYEKALALATVPEIHASILASAAEVARAGGWVEKARAYAGELVLAAGSLDEFFGEKGEAIHYGNIGLGKLDFEAGNVEGAKRYLLASGRTTGSAVLMSFGPDLALAAELLRLGERETVVQYLRLISNFWYTDNHQPQTWISMIERGEMPDFRQK